MQGRLVVGMNIHREICVLGMAGGVAILPEQVRTHRICYVSSHGVYRQYTLYSVCMYVPQKFERQVQGGLCDGVLCVCVCAAVEVLANCGRQVSGDH